ncbi:MAG TPA: TlpA disulfide reductase family protein [Steroidobacteraceae bacterium]|nr:TlpA disulfide reductase family protein [Steroidobacteraceae bacterium]
MKADFAKPATPQSTRIGRRLIGSGQVERSKSSFLSTLVLIVGSLVALPLTSSAAPEDIQGRQAPDFVLKTLEGGNLRLSEFRGEVVLINFWASWCGGCRQAMPALNDIYEKYRHVGLVMLSVNLDEEAHRAADMSESLKIKFPVLLDDRKIASQAFKVDNMPLTVLIDREGTVRFTYVGYNAGDESKILAPLRKLLNE